MHLLITWLYLFSASVLLRKSNSDELCERERVFAFYERGGSGILVVEHYRGAMLGVQMKSTLTACCFKLNHDS